jgi:APA family basic amino acid/polyamine antiporter
MTGARRFAKPLRIAHGRRTSSGVGTSEPSGGTEGRALGFWLCLALVVGNFIGSGIYLLPAQLAPLGWNALWGWIITIAGALCIAYVFAALARAMPLANGPYAYVDAAFGRLPAFVVAWSYWISLWVGNAAIGTAAISYLSTFFPALAAPGTSAVATIALIWLLTAVNCVSVRAGGAVQAVTVVIKLIPLVVVVILAALLIAGGGAHPDIPYRAQDISLSAISAAGALTLWAMLGIECAAVVSRRVRDPARNVPRATLIGTAFAGLVYLLTSTPITTLLPVESVATSNAPFALFVAHYWNADMARFVALFAAVSAAGTLNGFTLLQGELPLAMARDGTFPAWFAKVSARQIPVRGLILSSLLSTLLIAANASRTMGGLFAFMALLATSAALVLYLACALAVLRLQYTRRMARALPPALIALAGLLYALWTLHGAGAEATGWGSVLLLAGIPVYLAMRITSARAARPAASPE